MVKIETDRKRLLKLTHVEGSMVDEFGNKLDQTVYSLIQQVLTKHLLCSRHYSRHWEFNTGPDSQCLTPMKPIFWWGEKIIIKKQAKVKVIEKYKLGQYP